MKDIPEIIFLQIDEDGKDAESFRELETTYCDERIYKDDIEYILNYKYKKLELKYIGCDGANILLKKDNIKLEADKAELLEALEKCLLSSDHYNLVECESILNKHKEPRK